MSLRDKLLLVVILLVVAASLFLSHYWACTLFVIQRAVAFGFLPVHALTTLAPFG